MQMQPSRCWLYCVWSQIQETAETYRAEQLSAWGQHLPECLAADFSWYLSATLWQHTESLCLHPGDCRHKTKVCFPCKPMLSHKVSWKYCIHKLRTCIWFYLRGLWWEKCYVSTRVCSRASSASAPSSLTEPDQWGSLQMSPERQQKSLVLFHKQVHLYFTNIFILNLGEVDNSLTYF